MNSHLSRFQYARFLFGYYSLAVLMLGSYFTDVCIVFHFGLETNFGSYAFDRTPCYRRNGFNEMCLLIKLMPIVID